MRQEVKEKFRVATKNILEKNLKIDDERYIDKKVIFVYDLDSKLAIALSEGYISNLKGRKNTEIIDFNKIDKEELKSKLLLLEKGSTVVMVQSTNFMLDGFRIRLNLNNQGVGCLEHRHLWYIYDDQIENYADVIEYNTPLYEELGSKLIELANKADNMTFICHDGSTMKATGGFEPMKSNNGNYEGKNRGGNYPIGENFNEVLNFDKLNGELTIYSYPDDKLQLEFVEPFKIKIEKSMVTCTDINCPPTFRKILDFIAESEDGEVMLRELGFGLNSGISREKRLADVNSYERISGFHVSLGKKHQVYRKKFSKNIMQRYHIDIFPDIKEMWIDDVKIFENEKYLI